MSSLNDRWGAWKRKGPQLDRPEAEPALLGGTTAAAPSRSHGAVAAAKPCPQPLSRSLPPLMTASVAATLTAGRAAPSHALNNYRSGDGESPSESAPVKRTRLFQTPSTAPTRAKDYSLSATPRLPPTGARTYVSEGRSRFSRTTAPPPPPPPPPDASARALPAAAPRIVCAISENMARETCVASVDAARPTTTLQVAKQGNGQAYAETVACLRMLAPREVLLNEGRRHAPLARKVQELFQDPRGGNGAATEAAGGGPAPGAAAHWAATDAAPAPDDGTVVRFVSRTLFDQTRGAVLLQQVARDDTYEPNVVQEYIILSAVHALLVYLQQNLSATLAAKSLRLSINADGMNRMMIDRASLWQLELLVNSKTGKARNSLVGTIDYTQTTVGGRLLRNNLMSPPTNIDTIHCRLELVDTFLLSQDFFNHVEDHLTGLPDIDTMLAHIALIPRRIEVRGDEPTDAFVRMARKSISALISVKTVLSAMPALAQVLSVHLADLEEARRESLQEGATVGTSRESLMIGLGGTSPVRSRGRLRCHHLLRAITETISQPGLAQVLALVQGLLTPSTTHSRNADVRQHQECFALREEGGTMLAVIRQNYTNNVNDIYKKADEYAEKYGTHVSVRYTAARGYFLSVPSSFRQELPEEFINVGQNNRGMTFTTKRILELNLRVREDVRDILVMTHERIQRAIAWIRERHYDDLALLSDAIALLDMCHSFADNVILSPEPWCRPMVSDPDCQRTRAADGSNIQDSDVALMIKNGRFAIATPDAVDVHSWGDSMQSVIANDTYAARGKCFTVITGINGSGKTTYIKQIAIAVVLAHCGSYVPATQAIIPIRDRLCTRIGNTDDQEHSISTFMMEMKETAFICNSAGPRSLILLDELGRATSNEEGMSLAWAIAEYLLKKRSMTFFVTHYPQLTRLVEIYPSVQNIHLEASIERGAANSILYTHKVKPGACSVSTDYGVELAAACGWPPSYVAAARAMESHVQALLPGDSFCESPQDQDYEPDNIAFDNLVCIKDALSKMVRDDKLSANEFRAELVDLHSRLTPHDNPELLQRMKRLLLRDMDPTFQKHIDPHQQDLQDNSHVASASMDIPGPDNVNSFASEAKLSHAEGSTASPYGSPSSSNSSEGSSTDSSLSSSTSSTSSLSDRSG